MEWSVCIFGDIWRGLNDYNMMAGLRKFVTENWFFLFMTVFPISFEGQNEIFSVCDFMFCVSNNDQEVLQQSPNL